MRAALTLIEILVVVTILAVLASMVLMLDFGEEDVSVLRQAAVDLRNTLLKARSLGMRTQTTYAVTFNIESPDPKVLRNFHEDDPAEFPGRHWYAIIAPCNTDETRARRTINLPPQLGRSVTSLSALRNQVRDKQFGGRIFLPRGVRFLALSDHDGSNGTNQYHLSNGSWGRSQRSMIYPIPWFGRVINRGYDGVQASQVYRLFTWGFHEDGDDPDVRHGVLPGTSAVSTALASAWGASPPNIIEGETLDAHLTFAPDGAVDWEHSYRSKSIDRQPGRGQANIDWFSGHMTAIHGGFVFTLARDVDPSDDIYPFDNYHQFASERDALASIVPFIRVSITTRSGVTAIHEGLTGVPTDLHWTRSDGTVKRLDEMSPLWHPVDPLCRVQQNQAVHAAMADAHDMPEHAKSYHQPENPFIVFRRACDQEWSDEW